MTIAFAAAIFTIILFTAWGGMRLMQRTTGCARPAPEETSDSI